MMKQFKVFIFFLLIGSTVLAQTDGELTVSVKTSDTGGNFKPRNVVAIWVENNSGEFVKTLLAYANGIYLVKINTGHNILTRRIIKQ